MENKEHYAPKEIAEFAKLIGSVYAENAVLATQSEPLSKNTCASALLQAIESYKEGTPQNLQNHFRTMISGLERTCSEILNSN